MVKWNFAQAYPQPFDHHSKYFIKICIQNFVSLYAQISIYVPFHARYGFDLLLLLLVASEISCFAYYQHEKAQKGLKYCSY